jgi:hypothetical protein
MGKEGIHSVPEDRNVLAELRTLNQQYIDAFMNADVEWYRKMLSEDFVCIESDGTTLNKSKFLAQAAKGPDVKSYELTETNVRIYGCTALVQATGSWVMESGRKGLSRYTDIYVKESDTWKVVSAQITRTSGPA